MFNKKLKEEITNLNKRIEEISEEMGDMNKTIGFILKYGKDHVNIKINKRVNLYTYECEICAEYIDDAKYCKVTKDVGCGEAKIIETRKVDDDNYIVKIKIINTFKILYAAFSENRKEEEEYEIKYFLFDMQKGEFVDITSTKELWSKYQSKTTTKERKPKIAKDKKGIEVEPPKVDKRKQKVSRLSEYYDKYHLNLSVKDFEQKGRLSEKDTATLLYLFDTYKYVDEIVKHIDLASLSIQKYAYELSKEGYLLYKNKMGRVLNGSLIYNKEIK